MKFAAAAVIAAAAGASAGAAHGNVSYTTEVVEVYTTYCPAPTEITHGGKTYTVTKATTLTITDCPCTITKPVITTSAVICHDCAKPPPVHKNGTFIPAVPTTPGAPSAPSSTPTRGSGGGSSGNTPTAGAGKVAALSGAAFAGVFALVAFL